MKTTLLVNTLPPEDIYEVLHMAEAAHIQLPKSVERWWEKETVINEKKREANENHCGRVKRGCYAF